MQPRLALTALSFGLFAACGPHDVDLGGGSGGAPGEDGSGGDGVMTGGTTGRSFATGGAGGTGGDPAMSGGMGAVGGDTSSTGGVGGGSMGATGGMPDGSGGVGVGGGPAEQYCGNGIIEPPELCDDGMLPVMCSADCGLSASGGGGGAGGVGGTDGVGGSMPEGSGGLGGSMATGGGPAMGGMGGTDGSACFAEVVFETMGVCADNDVLLARGYERCAAVGSVLTSIFFAEPCAESQSYSVVIECCPSGGAGGSTSTGGSGGVGGTDGGSMTGGSSNGSTGGLPAY